jgi:hypothetical protein
MAVQGLSLPSDFEEKPGNLNWKNNAAYNVPVTQKA